MGNQWQYKPDHNDYKSGTELIEILIETRAKGGALLLNIGPDPYGEIPEEQESRLRELAAWHFINGEAISNVRPWIITNEENIWFCKKKDENTVYAFLTGIPNWRRGARKEFVLSSVKSTQNTEISILGQSGRVVEYQPDVDATSRYQQSDNQLKISCVRAQRIFNNHKWHNPLVVKLQNVEPAFVPPLVETSEDYTIINSNSVLLQGVVKSMGDAEGLKVGFQYKEMPTTLKQRAIRKDWKESKFLTIYTPKEFKLEIDRLESKETYQFRAIVVHSHIKLYGEIFRFQLN
jgi:alpha-L-fucosidase